MPFSANALAGNHAFVVKPSRTAAASAARTSGIAKATRPFGRKAVVIHAYSVQLEHSGGITTLEVPQGESILSVAVDAGLDVPHDCKLGVCMNCAARLVSGQVDQSAGMLSDDVKEKGYVLLCCALPQGDVEVKVIEEEELLAEVMQT